MVPGKLTGQNKPDVEKPHPVYLFQGAFLYTGQYRQ